MSIPLIEDFNNTKQTISTNKKIVESIQNSLNSVLEANFELMKNLQQAKEAYVFAENAINDIPQTSVNTMSEKDYAQYIQPYKELCIPAGSLTAFHSEIQKTNEMTKLQSSTSAAFATTVCSTANQIYLYAQDPTNSLYPHKNIYLEEFKERDILTKNISIIKQHLACVFPNILTEFLEFEKKFSLHQSSESKSQELIAFRSTMYFKLIFQFAESNGINKPHTREEQISYFATKKIIPDKIDEGFIKGASDLWKELSDQDPKGNSVKAGSPNLMYVNGLFNKIISTLATLLIIRKKYFP